MQKGKLAKLRRGLDEERRRVLVVEVRALIKTRTSEEDLCPMVAKRLCGEEARVPDGNTRAAQPRRRQKKGEDVMLAPTRAEARAGETVTTPW